MSQKKRIRKFPEMISLASISTAPAKSAKTSQAGPAPSICSAEKGGTALKTVLAGIMASVVRRINPTYTLAEGSSISLYAPDEKAKAGSLSFTVDRGKDFAGGRAPFEEISDDLNKNLNLFVSEGIEINLPEGTETLEQCRIVGIGQGRLRLAPVPVPAPSAAGN